MEKSLNQIVNAINKKWEEQKKEIWGSSPYLQKQIQILSSIILGIYEVIKFPDIEKILLSKGFTEKSLQLMAIYDFVSELEGQSFEIIRQANKINEIVERIGGVKIDEGFIDLVQNLLDETEKIIPNVEKTLDEYERIQQKVKDLNIIYKIEKPEEVEEDDW